MRRMGLLSVALATAVGVGGCGHRDAANSPRNALAAVGTSGDSARDNLSSRDKDFVHELAISNMADADLGRLATLRSANGLVREFGQMMADDHPKAGAALKAIASKQHIPVPSEIDGRHRDLHDKLANLLGADFDREYMAAIVKRHEDILELLESRVDKRALPEWKAQAARAKAIAIVAEKSDNEVTMAINKWAADSYPVVAAHLDEARELLSAVKARLAH
jgi:putative membrane protein